MPSEPLDFVQMTEDEVLVLCCMQDICAFRNVFIVYSSRESIDPKSEVQYMLYFYMLLENIPSSIHLKWHMVLLTCVLNITCDRS